MRRINIYAEIHIEGNRGRLYIGNASADFDRAAHAPVVESTPACAEECVGTSLVEGQCHICDFARGHVNWLHIHLPNSESMHDIIRCQMQGKGLANLRFQSVWTPAALLRHADM